MSLAQPKLGFASLGCPKALVDSERILGSDEHDLYGLAGADPD